MFFFNDPATTEIYTLSLHDALPICPVEQPGVAAADEVEAAVDQPGEPALVAVFVHEPRAHHRRERQRDDARQHRSEEHTSELQSRQYLVCRLLLEKIIMLLKILLVS